MSQIAYVKDPSGVPIQAAQEISRIMNVALSSVEFTAITLPAGVYCTSVRLRVRGGAAFYIAAEATPTEYYTTDVNVPFSLDIVGKPGATLCYVMGTAVGQILEAMFLK